MIDGLIAGRIYGQPKRGTSKNGGIYVTAKVRATGGDGDALFVNVITFSGTAGEALIVLGDGDAVALSGSLTPRVWTGKSGEARPSVDMQAHAVLTAYQARKRRQTAGQAEDDGAGAGL